MKAKFFINAFFENKKIFIIFLFILTVMMSYLGIQMMMLEGQAKYLGTPDISLGGRLDEDGVYRYKFYSDLNKKIFEDLKVIEDNQVKIYPAIIRNIAFINNPNMFQRVTYNLVATNEDFFHNVLKNHLLEGRIPENENEVIIGAYASSYFNVKIGDSIPIELSLDYKNESGENYKVVGTLGMESEFFKGSILKINTSDINNNYGMIYLLSNEKENYDEITTLLTSNGSEYGIGSMQDTFMKKQQLKQQKMLNIISISVVGFMTMIMMVLYLIKGLTKKIGLMKALGLRTITVYKIFLSGLSLITGASMVISTFVIYMYKVYINSSASKFYKFDVEVVNFSLQTFGILLVFTGLMIATISVFLYHRTMKVSPKEALAKN